MKTNQIKVFIITLLIVFGLCPNNSQAQIELSSSINFGFPILINNYNQNLFYGQLAAGMKLGVSYKPNETQFYPTLEFAFGRTRLPIQQFESNVAYLSSNYMNVMAKANFVMNVFGENTLFLGLGIGLDHLNTKAIGVSGTNGGMMRAVIDSTSNINKFAPAVALGLEYVYGESVGKQLYMSVGADVHATLLLQDQNEYAITIHDATNNILNYNSALEGKLITPDFHITLHYMLGKELFVWKGKNKDK